MPSCSRSAATRSDPSARSVRVIVDVAEAGYAARCGDRCRDPGQPVERAGDHHMPGPQPAAMGPERAHEGAERGKGIAARHAGRAISRVFSPRVRCARARVTSIPCQSRRGAPVTTAPLSWLSSILSAPPAPLGSARRLRTSSNAGSKLHRVAQIFLEIARVGIGNRRDQAKGVFQLDPHRLRPPGWRSRRGFGGCRVP